VLYIGIDLSLRKSGFAVLNDGKKVVDLSLLPYEKVEDAILGVEGKKIVCIDAPLSEPLRGIWRECDLLLRKEGIPCFPPSAPFFYPVTKAGISLRKKLGRRGIEILEVYPYATRVLCGIAPDAKKKSRGGRERIQVALSVTLDLPKRRLSEHELDAVISAYTGYLVKRGKAKCLSGRDGKIFIGNL
jgi:hypothetical protein